MRATISDIYAAAYCHTLAEKFVCAERGLDALLNVQTIYFCAVCLYVPCVIVRTLESIRASEHQMTNIIMRGKSPARTQSTEHRTSRNEKQFCA